MISLDKELVGKIKGLKLVLSEEPQPELLIRLPNQYSETPYIVETTTKEFTSLCPLNLAQPDYATITLRYMPLLWCIELKSLKFFYVSFRQVPIFHEAVPALMLKSLYELLEPVFMEVVGEFSTRGGISTTVRASYSLPYLKSEGGS